MKKTTENNENTPKLSIVDALITGDKIKSNEIEHLIEPVFVKGSIIFMGGREDCGKSTIGAQTCVNLAKGEMTIFDDPEKFSGRRPMRTLYIDKEEPEDAIARRFERLGVNENVGILNKSHPLVQLLRTDSDELRELIEYFRPELVVLAPFHSFLPDRCNENSKKDVCRATLPLINLAEKYNCCILIIGHTIKAENPDYRKCIAGSSYMSEAPRTVLMVHRPDQYGDTVYVSCEKASLISVYEPYKTRILKFRRDQHGFDVTGTTDKRWRDLILQAQGKDIAESNKAATQAERKFKLAETKEIIVKVLSERGSMQRDALINATLELGASTGVWERARKALIDENIIVADTIHHGQSKTTTYRLANDEGVLVEDVFDTKGGAA